jgi:hypothetical protein
VGFKEQVPVDPSAAAVDRAKRAWSAWFGSREGPRRSVTIVMPGSSIGLSPALREIVGRPRRIQEP